MKHILISVLVVFSLLYSSKTNAQKQQLLQPAKANIEGSSDARGREMTPKFSTSSVARESVSTEKSLLQEIYSIDDQRQNIEKNKSLSSMDREQQLKDNNANYLLKKNEFVNYVNSKGILNVSKNEQNYYLYILKNDKNDIEYTRNVELINNSK